MFSVEPPAPVLAPGHFFLLQTLPLAIVALSMEEVTCEQTSSQKKYTLTMALQNKL